MADTSEPDPDDRSDDPTYAYKPSLIGAPWEFALRPDGLRWSVGRYSGLLRYDRVSRVRLSFRPVTMQSHRFLTEIWSPDCPKIQIASASWRSITEQERFDAAYAAFIVELHKRLAAAGSTARFTTGVPAPIYVLGVLVLIGAAVAIGILAVRALMMQQWAAAAFVGGFVVLFGWQLGNYFRRNRPGPYDPSAVPDYVLPKR